MSIKRSDREAIATALASWRECSYEYDECEREDRLPIHPNFVTIQQVDGSMSITANGACGGYEEVEDVLGYEGLVNMATANPTIEYKLLFVTGKVAVVKMRISDTARALDEPLDEFDYVETHDIDGVWLVNMLSYTPGKWLIVSMTKTYGHFDEEDDRHVSVVKINRSKTKQELYKEEEMRMRGEPVEEDPNELKQQAKDRAKIRKKIKKQLKRKAEQETEDVMRAKKWKLTETLVL